MTPVVLWRCSDVPSVSSMGVPCIPVDGLFVYIYICAWWVGWVIVVV